MMVTIVKESVTSQPGGTGSSRGRSVRLVPFLYGVSGRTELSGPVLVQLLGDLDLTATAARALIARMQRAGQLAGRRQGRSVHYRLVGSFAQAFERIRTGGTAPVWDGSFHALLYAVPESQRAFRDQLRRTALFVGYGLLQQGVLIAPTDRSRELATILAGAPHDCQLYRTRLHLAPEDATRAAATAWDLAGLDRTYRAQTRRLHAALRGRATPPPATGATLRRLEDLVSTPLLDTLRVTGLPAELLPADFGLADLRAAIGETTSRYRPACVAHIDALIDR
jgi:phenylacetic acid degradation operon negative regulatory protein